MADPWDPPVDASGGYFLTQYSNGTYSHRQRLHIGAFNVLGLAYTAPIGAETHVGDTINAWFDILKLFYTNAWTISLLSLWRVVEPAPPVFVIPPVITPRVGTNAGAEAVDPAGMFVFNMRTQNGNKMRIQMVAPALWANQPPEVDTPATAGNVGTMLTYLGGANCMIEAHDGSRPITYCHTTFPYNRKLRRHYHLD